MTAELITQDSELAAELRRAARTEAPPHHRPGTRLGPYELVGLLGRGGMGFVYRARDVRLGRDVAIKLLLPSTARDVSRRSLLEREARATAAIVHPNVAAVFDVGEWNGAPYLVMELVDGTTLRHELARGPIPPARALSVARQIAVGLEAAHRASVVHRDLKPENVMVNARGDCKILDFGLARSRPEVMPVDAPNETSLAGCGTRGYMAPEQAAGQAVDARADVFAFGVVLRELFAGSAEAPLPHTVPRPIALLAAACTEVDPDRRPANGAAVVRALKDIPRGRPSRGWAAAIAAALAVALMAWLRVRSASSPPQARVRPITTNSAEAAIWASALSPDGATVAYAEKRGAFVVPSNGTAAPRLVSTERDLKSLSFLPDGTGLLLACPHRLSIIGLDGAPVMSVEGEFVGGAVSPDGSRIAVVDRAGLSVIDRSEPHNRRALYEFDANGGPGQVGSIWSPAWSPSGKNLLWSVYCPAHQVDARLLLVDAATGATRVLLHDPLLYQEAGGMAATFRAEDRIVAAFGASRTRGGAIREIGIDGSVRRDLLATGRAAISDLSVSRDGERIAFLSAPPQTDVHIGELGPGGHSLSALHRVTLSDGDERPSAFAQDGTVLVVGDEFGGEHAMGVDPETGLAQPLFKDTWTTWTASAGGLVVAFRLEPHATDLVDVSLVNSHGRARSLGSEALPPRRGRPLPYDRELRCAMASCVLAAVTEAGVTLSLVEPETLTSQPLGTMSEIDAIRGFALARDGARVAILDRAGNFSIAARDGKRLTTVSHPEGCSPRWATFNFEGDALIATMLCDDAKPFQIRRIPLVGGPSQILASSNDAWYGNPVVSPDGSHLAITVEQFAANVQVLEVLDGGS